MVGEYSQSQPPICLHALWIRESGVLAFWGEDKTQYDSLNPTSKNLQVLTLISETIPNHPYALPSENLTQQLNCYLDAYSDYRSIFLPSTSQAPYPSWDQNVLDSYLLPWRVPTREVLIENFVDFILHSSPSLETLTKAGIWGDDFLFWVQLVYFARALYESQYAAPGITFVDGKMYPFWYGMLNHNVEEYFDQYTQTIPFVAIAQYLSPQFHPTPYHILIQEVVINFLDFCIDSLIRSHLRCRSPRQPTELHTSKTAPSLFHQWLTLLEKGMFQPIHSNSKQALSLYLETKYWINPYRSYHNSGYDESLWRLCLVLYPPDNNQTSWLLELWMNPKEKNLSPIQLKTLWENLGEKRPWLPEILLSLWKALGKAMKIFPLFQEYLSQTQYPTHLELSTDQVSIFLESAVPTLQREGIDVILPECLRNETDGVLFSFELHPVNDLGPSPVKKIPTDSESHFLTLDSIVQISWKVGIGDLLLSNQEFQNLLHTQSSLFKIRNQWYRINVHDIHRFLPIINILQTEKKGRLSDLISWLNEIQQKYKLSINRLRVGDFEPKSKSLPSFQILPTPQNFCGILPPYQQYGFSWMYFLAQSRRGGCLADDMGLGKTIQTIAFLVQLYHENPNASPSLVICPMSVVGNWAHECKRFAPHLKIMIHHGQDRTGIDNFMHHVLNYQIVITTYNLVTRDVKCFLSLEWYALILDEAQHIKNPSTKQSIVIHQLKGRFRFCLTGTPIENHLSELWSLMEFLNPGLLGPLKSFQKNFARPIEQNHQSANKELLKQIIRPFVLRRLKSDQSILHDLPGKNEMKIYSNLTLEQATLYRQTVDNALLQIQHSNGIRRRGLILALLVKLKQIINHPLLFLKNNTPFSSDRSGKLQRLEEMLSVILEEEGKSVIFTQFAEFGSLLQQKLHEYFSTEILYLCGKTPQRKRDEMVQRFQNPHGPRIFILSLKAGGLGLNLSAAHHVFHFDRWWNPAVEDQATDRTHRIGQTKHVQVYKFVCVGTIEEKIDELLEKKRNLSNEIIVKGEHAITELSFEELEYLFKLDTESVVE